MKCWLGRRTRVVLGLVCCVLALAMSAEASLILNGGFEMPVIPNGTFQLFPNIPGWSVLSGSVIEIQRNVAGAPFEGQQFVELDSVSPTTIFQDVGGLTVGTTYRLDFAFSARASTSIPNDNILSVTFGGAPVFTNLPAPTVNPNWTVFSALVTASQTTERLTFGDTSPNAQNSFGVYIDDIRLNQVPEPATIFLLGGMWLVCCYRRRASKG